jgi:flagellar hook-basal body complex protein FliE
MDLVSALRSTVQPLLQRGADLRPPLPPPALADLPPLDLTPTPAVTGTTGASPSFDRVLGTLVEGVNAKQIASRDAVRQMLSGEDIPLHRVMLASEEASISFQLMVEVRNKLVESYQELMRMQV